MSYLSDPTWWRPNSSFLYCGQYHRLIHSAPLWHSSATPSYTWVSVKLGCIFQSPSPQQLRFWIWLSFGQAKEMEVDVSWWVTSSLFYPFILIPSCFLGNGHDNWSTSSQSETGKERPQELQSLCPAILGSQPVLRTAFLLMSFTWENKLFCWSHCSQVSVTISQILVLLFLLLMMTQGFVQWPQREI